MLIVEDKIYRTELEWKKAQIEHLEAKIEALEAENKRLADKVWDMEHELIELCDY